MNSQFSCVGLVGRIANESTQYALKNLLDFLSSRNVNVLLDEETSSVLDDSDVDIVSRKLLGKKCDLIIVVGGDGSILSAARSFAGNKVKLLGINRGRLGFLTDISPEEIEAKVSAVLEGKYLSEKRFLLSAELIRNGENVSNNLALNDVVIHPGQFIRMIEFDLYINGEYVYRQRSDGLIISTPTGSTAYALSCGGSIMHPNLDAIVLVPMNPHTLTSRPIIVHGDSEIKLKILDKQINPHMSCDGQTHVVTQEGDEVQVKKATKEVELIHPEDHNFYETCRSKLGWASHLTPGLALGKTQGQSDQDL